MLPSLIFEQLSGQTKPWEEHFQPIGVKASLGLSVCDKALPRLSRLPAFDQVRAFVDLETVVVKKVAARVIRWIDVYHLYLAQIGLLQQL